METRYGILMAGVQSRCGKTTATLALMATLRRAGLAVAPFKAGPDFIDPSWHQAITGRPSHSLDTCMVGIAESQRLLATHGNGHFAVVEGVMGLYDGRQGIGGPGSTADLARALALPVVLVVDGHGMAGSIAPLVDGFCRYAQGFALAGVLATRLGGQSHAARLSEALQEKNLPPLLGWLARDAALALPERHLGLVMPDRSRETADHRWAAALHLDLPALLQAATLPPAPPLPPRDDTPPLLQGVHLAIARDEAFCFLYPANVDWLQRMGATLHFFSPLAGDPFPREADATWLPGGYPELYAAPLSASASWQGLAALVEKGGPLLAECGGMMALGQSLVDLAGASWPMANVLPITTRMTRRLAGLGYRQEAHGPRGHEFHHSTRDPCPLPGAFQVERGDPGVRYGSVRASYIHWYFPAAPEVCSRWFLPE